MVVWMQLSKLEAQVIELSRRLEQRPHVDAHQIDAVSLAAGSTTLVPHGLGRAVVGYLITDVSAAVTIFRDTSSTSDSSVYLPLQASGACIVGLLVW
jgi:hypothetical protein